MNYKRQLGWITAAVLLMLVNGLRAAPIELTHGEVDAAQPQWSPNGRWLAFSGEKNGKQSLWIVPSDGGKPLALVDDLADDTSFDWSRDSGEIAYTTRRHGKKWVCIVDVSSRKVKTVEQGFNPVYRPDGKMLAFLTSQDVMTMALPAGKPVNVTRRNQLSMLQQLCWSGDGKRIYYSRDGDLWAVDADGANNRRLVDHAAKGDISPVITHPMVSADGKHVFYSLITDGLYAGVSHNLVGCYDLAAGEAQTLVEADGWSLAPSGQWLVISIGGKLSRWEVRDHKQVPLGDGFFPAIGPKGERLAYCTRSDPLGAARIVVASPRGPASATKAAQ